jgi:hypothetical protein
MAIRRSRRRLYDRLGDSHLHVTLDFQNSSLAACPSDRVPGQCTVSPVRAHVSYRRRARDIHSMWADGRAGAAHVPRPRPHSRVWADAVMCVSSLLPRPGPKTKSERNAR